jgi:hypothetical protein
VDCGAGLGNAVDHLRGRIGFPHQRQAMQVVGQGTAMRRQQNQLLCVGFIVGHVASRQTFHWNDWLATDAPRRLAPATIAE